MGIKLVKSPSSTESPHSRSLLRVFSVVLYCCVLSSPVTSSFHSQYAMESVKKFIGKQFGQITNTVYVLAAVSLPVCLHTAWRCETA